MTEIINQGWMLKRLEIEQDWGDKKKYNGKIKFTNDKSESFDFRLPPEKLDAILGLIADSVVESARELGAGLIRSIRLPELPSSQPRGSSIGDGTHPGDPIP